ncbi:MAG: carbonic anhydrase [Burkholderiales bacterium]|nr:carbonic anhydrase [Burkholderiales bacterium]
MTGLADILARNRAWAERMLAADPEYFRALARGQAPQFLWIGCSDSRVPPNQITDLAPGELFVHRNIANLVLPADASCQAVLRFALLELGVRHVIVCGHYGCGGVAAALERGPAAATDPWLRHLVELRDRHASELEAIAEPAGRARRLVDLNVRAQVRHVCESAPVRQVWARGRPLSVHGWVYDIEDGLLRDLDCSASGAII